MARGLRFCELGFGVLLPGVTLPDAAVDEREIAAACGGVELGAHSIVDDNVFAGRGWCEEEEGAGMELGGRGCCMWRLKASGCMLILRAERSEASAGFSRNFGAVATGSCAGFWGRTGLGFHFEWRLLDAEAVGGRAEGGAEHVGAEGWGARV